MQELLRRANRAARIALDKDIAVPARLATEIDRALKTGRVPVSEFFLTN